jgi:hypothetical protein
VCEVAVDTLPVDGIALSIYLATGPEDLVGATDEWSVRLEELQYVVGEGPSPAAYETGQPVIMDRLGAAARRWPAFESLAGGHGLAAAVAWPVTMSRGAPIAVLSGYRRRPGLLGPRQFTDGVILADLVRRALIDDASGLTAVIAAEEDGYLGHYDDVILAAGRLARAHDLSYSDAFAVLRARTFVRGLSVHDVAREILDCPIRTDPSTEAES